MVLVPFTKPPKPPFESLQGMWTRFSEKLVGGLNGELARGGLAPADQAPRDGAAWILGTKRTRPSFLIFLGRFFWDRLGHPPRICVPSGNST